MAYKKIIFGDEVLMDLSDDTVTPETLLPGVIAHNSIGNQITGIATSDGTIEASDVIEGKVGYANGKKVTGTSKAYDSEVISYYEQYLTVNDEGLSVPLADGFYRDSSILINRNALNDTLGLEESKIIFGESIGGVDGTATSDADATPNDILEFKTSYVNGEKIEGVIPIVEDSDVFIKQKATEVLIDQGYHPNGMIVKISDTEQNKIIPENVKVGTDILGVTGTFTSDGDVTSDDILEGKVGYANGNRIEGTCTFDADTSDADATSDDILEGRTAYVNGVKITGTMKKGVEREMIEKLAITRTSEPDVMLQANYTADWPVKDLKIFGMSTQVETTGLIRSIGEDLLEEGGLVVTVSDLDQVTSMDGLSQTLHITTPTIIPGVKVSGEINEVESTYTDNNGNEWISDEVDFGRGVYVKRIGIIDSYDGSDIPSTWWLSNTGGLDIGATIYYVLPNEEIVEFPLSEEEMSEFKEFHTYDHFSEFTNNAQAYMRVTCILNTKDYIDDKFSNSLEYIIPY